MSESRGRKNNLRDVLNVSKHMECLFDRHGRLIARYPFRYIVACLLVTISLGSGIYFMHWETNIVRLWNPENSESGMNFKWLWQNHPPDLRRHSILFKAENMLSKHSLKQMVQVRKQLHSVVTPSGYTWKDVCLKVPYIPDSLKSFIGPGNDDSPFDEEEYQWDNDTEIYSNKDPLLEYYPSYLCPLFETLETVCLEDSILELFAKDGDITIDDIDNLSNQEIINAINNKNISEMFSVGKDFRSMLGNIQYNETGHIISAGVASLALMGKMDVSTAHKTTMAEFFKNQMSLHRLDQITDEIEETFITFLNTKSTPQAHQHQHNFYSHRITGDKLTIIQNVQKSYAKSINHNFNSEIPKILGSMVLMWTYVFVFVGKLSCVENRVFLACSGMMSVIFATITSYGLCSYFGLIVGQLHNLVPFIILAVGIDDMFVILHSHDYITKDITRAHFCPKKNQIQDCEGNLDQARNGIGPTELGKDLLVESSARPQIGAKGAIKSKDRFAHIEEEISEVMRHSGVSITITSLTDFIAFAIGGTTSIPALRSFCMFCGTGILSVYVFQATWFVAWMVVDERRKLERRNAFVPCISHRKNTNNDILKHPIEHHTENEEINLEMAKSCPPENQNVQELNDTPKNSRPNEKYTLVDKVMIKYGKILSHTATQLIVVASTICLLAVSVYGNMQLKENFDPFMFLPNNSTFRTWMDLHKSAFPSKGELVTIFFEGPPVDETGNLRNLNFTKLDWLANELQAQSDIVTNVDFWYMKYREYFKTNFESPDLTISSIKEQDLETINKTLVQFLFSQSGIKYKYLFDFQQDLECGGFLPKIEVHMMFITHVVINDSLTGIDTMNRIKSIIKKADFPYRVFAFSPLYSVWEIDEIIRGELYRNLGLATIAIYFTTLLLLSDFTGSLFCLLAVILTLTNVSGLMHFWGLAVDTVTATVLIICIGLSVDFAAHVVHCFMQTSYETTITTRDSTNANLKEETNKIKSKISELYYYINREEKSYRMRKSLIAIAPAILHGGLSTLLAVVLLAFSEVYVFVSFFKIFVLVVIFGLYNGLVVLPILLANFGPGYKRPEHDNQRSNAKTNQIALITPVDLENSLTYENQTSRGSHPGFDGDSNLNTSTITSQTVGFHSVFNSTNTKYYSDVGDDLSYKSELENHDNIGSEKT